jgi:RNA 3'-terminal phosphate cyclase-like protein
MSCKFIFNYQNFREKIALSLIYKKNIRINKIRKSENITGIRNFELDVLILSEKISFGSVIKINENGTILDFSPGRIENSKIEYNSTSFRSLSYYIEFFIYLFLSTNKKIQIKLTGIRSVSIDISLENILYVTIPLIRKLGSRDIRFKVYTILHSTIYNTQVIIFLPNIHIRKDFKLINLGKINKIRIINSFSGKNIIKKDFIELFIGKYFPKVKFDIKIIDLKISNKNFNFQTTTIITETTEGCLFGEDTTFVLSKNKRVDYNRILTKIFNSLLEDINLNNCVDKKYHIILFLKMLYNGKTSNSIICIGRLTFSDIGFLRDLKKISGIMLSIKYSSSVKKFLITLF